MPDLVPADSLFCQGAYKNADTVFCYIRSELYGIEIESLSYSTKDAEKTITFTVIYNDTEKIELSYSKETLVNLGVVKSLLYGEFLDKGLVK